VQQPDTQPGFYYVSVQRNNSNARTETRLLRGPFVNDHGAALAAIDEARQKAFELDPRSHWYSYGTCRAEKDLGPGLLDTWEKNLSKDI
jgi:hypothetical protein